MEEILNALGFGATPFYKFGVWLWNVMAGLIGMTAANTPATFSQTTWNYLTNTLYPWTSVIGATLLNISFYVGFVRQAGNLKQNFTLEIFVECCIKVVFGNALLVSGIELMKVFFEIASLLAGGILMETPVIFAQSDNDLGSMLFYLFFGFIFFIVSFVCSGTIFLTVYGRFLQLYLLAGTGPIAWGTLPGGPGMSQTAYAWIKTFFAKTFEIVLIVMALVLASKMCVAIEFVVNAAELDIFDGAFQALENIFTMVLLTASVKGMDIFIRRTFAL